MSLRLKFIMITVGITVAFGMTMMGVSLPMVEKVLHSYHDLQGADLARTVALYAAEPLQANDRLRLQLVLDRASNISDEIVYVSVIDPESRLVAHTFGDGIPANLPDAPPLAPDESMRHRLVSLPTGMVHDIAVPLLAGEYGALHLGFSEAKIHGYMANLRRSILLITLLLSIAGIFLVALLSELIIRPLDRLVNAVLAIGRGNFHHRIAPGNRDEIGRVAHAFNAMATQLETSIHKEKDTRARLEAIVENSAVGITITDRDGNIKQSNPAFCRMLGYTPAELMGRHLSMITHPDDVGKNSPVYQQLLEGGIDHIHFQKRYRHKDGKTVWGQLTLSLLRNEAGEPDLVIGMIEDISTRKLLEEERQKANKLESVGILAGGIAHDFNNLLTAVIGNLILARQRVLSDPNTRELLESAERASLRAKNLTDQLLTFSRGGAPVKKNVRLRELVEETIRFHLSGSKTRPEFRFGEGLWTVRADAGKISQVLQNIVKNSEQAMPTGGTITLTAENFTVTGTGLLPQGRYVKITIADQGGGIPEENLNRIFDPYFTTKEKGNGLGLAICYSIIKAHDGLITVNSTVGVGTAFAVYLPAAESPPARIDPNPEKDADADVMFSGKVLVMDDDQMVRDVLGGMLRDLGLTVVLTDDGRQAVAAYKQALQNLSPVHLVIVDLTVPGGMGGKETLEELKKIDPAVRVVVSSGYTDDPNLLHYADQGFIGVIAKPFSRTDLISLLTRSFAKG